MFKVDLEKAEEPEIKLPTSMGSQKKHTGKIKKLRLMGLNSLAQRLAAVQQGWDSDPRTCVLV